MLARWYRFKRLVRVPEGQYVSEGESYNVRDHILPHLTFSTAFTGHNVRPHR